MRIRKLRDALSNTDVIVFSLGKSGRTWLRFMLNKYLSLQYGVPFSSEDLHKDNDAIPRIMYSHHLWVSSAHFPRWLNNLLARFPVVSQELLNSKKVVLLSRDPRDTIVSNYFQLTKRANDDKRIDNISISDFIRHRHWGLRERVEVMNKLYELTRHHPNRLILTYEAMKANPAKELERLITYLGIEVNPLHIAAAVEFANFDNMRRMEASSEVSRKMLRPGDPNDPDSFKVRKGKVGGYVEYFGEADLRFIEERVAALLPEYGYQKPSAGSAARDA
jgi:hypothetical protein